MPKGCTWALSDMLLMTKKTGKPTPTHTFTICSTSRKSLALRKKPMTAATVPSVALNLVHRVAQCVAKLVAVGQSQQDS